MNIWRVNTFAMGKGESGIIINREKRDNFREKLSYGDPLPVSNVLPARNARIT